MDAGGDGWVKMGAVDGGACIGTEEEVGAEAGGGYCADRAANGDACGGMADAPASSVDKLLYTKIQK